MGFTELLLVLFVVLLFFGARKLPGIGAGLGKAARGFKDALTPDRPPAAKPEPPAPPPRELPPK
ncbi:MAG TPA: twin-arginine translocase TatA/TatE family subunit [Anaeromyxobacter sp.]|nr:twin-arginine translocase TatA/TatE family subunit [Anaeromyxobacter sp.]